MVKVAPAISNTARSLQAAAYTVLTATVGGQGQASTVSLNSGDIVRAFLGEDGQSSYNGLTGTAAAVEPQTPIPVLAVVMATAEKTDPVVVAACMPVPLRRRRGRSAGGRRGSPGQQLPGPGIRPRRQRVPEIRRRTAGTYTA